MRTGALPPHRTASYMPHSPRSAPQSSPIVRARRAPRGGREAGSRRSRRRARILRDGRLGRGRVAPGAQGLQPLELARSIAGSSRCSSTRRGSSLANAVDADDHALARLDLAAASGTPPPRSRACTQPSSIAATAPPSSSIRAISSRARASSSSVSASTKYEPPSGSAVSVVAGLVREHLLRAQRDRRRVLGRQRERLVERVRVQRLRAAADGRERLRSRRGRRCSPAAARSASSRRSARGSAAPAPSGSSRRSARA